MAVKHEEGPKRKNEGIGSKEEKWSKAIMDLARSKNRVKSTKSVLFQFWAFSILLIISHFSSPPKSDQILKKKRQKKKTTTQKVETTSLYLQTLDWREIKG